MDKTFNLTEWKKAKATELEEWKKAKVTELKEEIRQLLEIETKDNAKEIDDAVNDLHKMILLLRA